MEATHAEPLDATRVVDALVSCPSHECQRGLLVLLALDDIPRFNMCSLVAVFTCLLAASGVYSFFPHVLSSLEASTSGSWFNALPPKWFCLFVLMMFADTGCSGQPCPSLLLFSLPQGGGPTTPGPMVGDVMWSGDRLQR